MEKIKGKIKIAITGGTGLLGKAFQQIHKNPEYDSYKFVFLSSDDYDLTNISEVRQMFITEEPEIVIHLAAEVGGLFKNMRNKVRMFNRNIIIN